MNSQKKIVLAVGALAIGAALLVAVWNWRFLVPSAERSMLTPPALAPHAQPAPVPANAKATNRYTFFVYWTSSSPGKLDDIQASITRWGGQVQDQLTIDTDFVVVGSRPDDDLSAKKYDEVLNESKELGIPIMDRNRLLYFLGLTTTRPNTGT